MWISKFLLVQYFDLCIEGLVNLSETKFSLLSFLKKKYYCFQHEILTMFDLYVTNELQCHPHNFAIQSRYIKNSGIRCAYTL